MPTHTLTLLLAHPLTLCPLLSSLTQALTYEDIEGVDPAYYKNLVWMLEVGGSFWVLHKHFLWWRCT
jgi:hypothetical protein